MPVCKWVKGLENLERCQENCLACKSNEIQLLGRINLLNIKLKWLDVTKKVDDKDKYDLREQYISLLGEYHQELGIVRVN